MPLAGLMAIGTEAARAGSTLRDSVQEPSVTQKENEAQHRHRADCGRAELKFMLVFLKLGQEHFWRL